ncbi:unnamed protein product [Caenorhabditis nigoni]
MGSKLCNLEYLEIDTVAFQDAESYTNEILKDLDWTDGNENDGRPTTVLWALSNRMAHENLLAYTPLETPKHHHCFASHHHSELINTHCLPETADLTYTTHFSTKENANYYRKN